MSDRTFWPGGRQNIGPSNAKHGKVMKSTAGWQLFVDLYNIVYIYICTQKSKRSQERQKLHAGFFQMRFD